MNKKIVFLFVFLICLTLSAAVSASVDAVYDDTSGRVSIILTLPEKPQHCFGIVCAKLPEDAEPELKAMFEEYLPVTYFNILTDAEGRASYVFEFAPDAPNGTYTVLVTDGVTKDTAVFRRYSEEICRQNIEILNKETDKEKFKELFYKMLGDDMLPVSEDDVPPESKDKAASIMFSVKPSGTMLFKETFGKAVLLAQYSLTDKDSMIGFIKKNAKKLGLEPKYLDEMTSAQKLYFAERFAGSDISSLSAFEDEYYTDIALSWASKPSNYTDIRKAVSTFGQVKADLEGDYAALSDKAQVFKNMTDREYRTKEELLDEFAKQVEEVKKSGAKGNSKGSAGGSKGSGGEGGAPVGSSGGSTPAEKSVQYTEFSDINDVPWASEAIADLHKKGIISGDGSGGFSPLRNITRSEFVKMLVGAFGLEDKNAVSPFSDTDPGAWDCIYIASAYKYGLIKGKTSDVFGGADLITREDMTLILYRLAARLGMEFGGETQFSDSDQISEYAREAVAKMASGGIVRGDGERFDPKANAQRAQCAVMIFRLLERAGA